MVDDKNNVGSRKMLNVSCYIPYILCKNCYDITKKQNSHPLEERRLLLEIVKSQKQNSLINLMNTKLGDENLVYLCCNGNCSDANKYCEMKIEEYKKIYGEPKTLEDITPDKKCVDDLSMEETTYNIFNKPKAKPKPMPVSKEPKVKAKQGVLFRRKLRG